MKKNVVFLTILSIVVSFLTACSSNDISSDYLAVKISGDNNWSILNVNSGEFVYRDEFKNCPSVIVDDLFFVEKDKGNGYECYNIDNISNPINNETYVYANNFQSGVAPVLKKGDPITIINTKGEEVKVLDKSIVNVLPFTNGFSNVCTKDGKVGIINTKGDWVIKADYERIIPFSKDGYAVTMKKQNDTIYNYTIVDKNGEKFYSFSSEKYEPIGSVVNGTMPVRKDDKVIYIDKKGERVLDAGKFVRGTENSYGMYDDITVYASEDGKMGLMNYKGEKLIRDKYDLIIPQKDGKFQVLRDGKIGLIDKDDNIILPIEYLKIQKLKDDRYVVREGSNKYSLIDEKGGEICKETLASISLYNDAPVVFDARTQIESFVEETTDVMDMLKGFDQIIESLGDNSEIVDGEVPDDYDSLPDDEDVSDVDGERTMHGVVDKYPITMRLIINGSDVSGDMYYDRYGSSNKFYVKGEKNGNSIELDEYDNNSNRTGHYSGSINSNVIEGYYTRSDNKIMSFKIER